MAYLSLSSSHCFRTSDLSENTFQASAGEIALWVGELDEERQKKGKHFLARIISSL